MKKIVLILVMSLVMMFSMSAPAQADPGCVITVGGIKVCGELLNAPLPEIIKVTVTATPAPVIVPGPTVTIKPPASTVTVPGPVVTVTESTAPETVTTTPDAVPDETTATEIVTRQPSTTPATMKPDTSDEPNTTSIVEIVGIGLLTLIALGLLGFFSLLLGYYLGRRDKGREEKNFLNRLLNFAVRPEQHR